YQEGRGVKKSSSKAIMWYKKAAKNGDKDAQNFLKSYGIKY
ncbi:MAG: SEL1-like repeat protein, partial [Pasteurella sp.]|nr:SEL1-like repeat protein [Pasteurella sp.]